MTTRIYGGFYRRFFAFTLDNVIIYILSFVVLLIGTSVLGTTSAHQAFRSAGGGLLAAAFRFALLFNLLHLFMSMVYFTYFIGLVGKTPGKMIFGLRVIRDSGESLTFGTAFLRWIGYFLSSLPLYLGFIWIAFDRKKQGFHDKLAQTVVILDETRKDGEMPPAFQP
ncbi:MAG: RDD family protein [Deltaproteobacteria bacterium]|nr:RDD family protein [Deltaproteobacteria bacterium]